MVWTNLSAKASQSPGRIRRKGWSKPNWTPRRGSSSFAPVPKTKKSPAAEVSPDVSFEDALKKLEGIVEEMESDALPLEDLLTHYEQGTRLAAVCQKKLAEAELKIQKLEKNPDGRLELSEFPLEDDAVEQDSQ